MVRRSPFARIILHGIAARACERFHSSAVLRSLFTSYSPAYSSFVGPRALCEVLARERDVGVQRGSYKKRPPIGGTPGGLALPDKGRGNRGMGPYPVALI